MKNKRNNNRFGGAIGIIITIIVIVGLIAAGIFGYTYNSGKELQTKQTRLWAEAFTDFGQKQPESAYLKLVEIRSCFGDSLDFYRQLATGTFITKEEVNEAIVLICQSEAYDNLFKLESAANWLEKEKSELANIEDKETKEELAGFIARAEAADKLCAKYHEYSKAANLQADKYQDMVRESIKIGSEAIYSSDYDYTIFEIRFLIACGKTFNEPILVTEARKQLIDLTKAFGENEKTKLLWGLLKN